MAYIISSNCYWSLINYFNYACFPYHELLRIRFNSLFLNHLDTADLYVPLFVVQSLLGVTSVFFHCTFAETSVIAFTVRDSFC